MSDPQASVSVCPCAKVALWQQLRTRHASGPAVEAASLVQAMYPEALANASLSAIATAPCTCAVLAEHACIQHVMS